jgi:hypothetical protein
MSSESGGGDGGAAMRALALGSVLLSIAEASPDNEDEESDFALMLVSGAVLMAFEAFYARQLRFGASRCGLKRLRKWCEEDELADLSRIQGL